MRGTERQGTLSGALLALVAAALGLATAFGVHISTQEHAAVLTFCGAVSVAAPLIGALFDHSNKQAHARQAAAATIATQNSTTAQAAALQAQIDALTAQKEALG